jgi:hypothetical protein
MELGFDEIWKFERILEAFRSILVGFGDFFSGVWRKDWQRSDIFQSSPARFLTDF